MRRVGAVVARIEHDGLARQVAGRRGERQGYGQGDDATRLAAGGDALARRCRLLGGLHGSGRRDPELRRAVWGLLASTAIG